MIKKKRIWLYKHEANSLGLTIKENEGNRNQARYYITKEQLKIVKENRITPNERQFIETQRKKNKDGEVTSTIEKLQSEPIDVPDDFEVIKISTSKTTGQQWIQYAPKKDKEVKEFDYKKIISKYIKPLNIKKIKVKQNLENDFDTLTYSDVHIGMDTDKYNNTMYQNEWNKKELMRSAEIMIDKTLSEQQSSVLYVDELGDLLDGYNGQTTRGCHELPQNMTNEEVFDIALKFKLTLLHNLIPFYDKIVFNNICNDNHAGSFGYFVNSAFKQIAELQFKNVEVNNHRKFINHYTVNNVTFLISHGKDSRALKFGFKPFIDANSIEKIDQYIKQNDLYKKSDLIIFKKGDSHQALFDMCSSDDFFYFNYPAFSPSSDWVKSNFKLGRRGFVNESFKGLTNYLKPSFIK